jgi:hypothetical protein
VRLTDHLKRFIEPSGSRQRFGIGSLHVAVALMGDDRAAQHRHGLVVATKASQGRA